MRSISNSARTRSSSPRSRIEPVTSRSTFEAIVSSRRERSMATIARSRRSARRAISPWPISPPAPVMRTTGLRTVSDEDGEDGGDDRERGQAEADGGADEVIHALAFERVEPHAGEIPAGKSARVRGVVDARHQQAEHEQRDRVPGRFGANEAASAAAAVVDERAEQAEDGSGRAQRVAAAREEGNLREGGEKRAEEEARHARNRVDDDHPRRAVRVGDDRSELTDPHHVEEDVQQPSVHPAGAQQRPPSSFDEYGVGAARPEGLERQ